MKKVCELELWSKPNANLPEDVGLSLVKKAIIELELDKIIVGLSFLPDSTDVENLKICLAEKELDIFQFKSYCSKNNLSNDLNNAESAALFLEYEYGRPLAWIHIPTDVCLEETIQKIKNWAKKSDSIIIEPEDFYCLI